MRIKATNVKSYQKCKNNNHWNETLIFGNCKECKNGETSTIQKSYYPKNEKNSK